MLLTPQGKAASRKRTELSGWKRFTRKPSPKPTLNPDNVEQWVKRVERASELAVSKPFSAGNSVLPRRLWGQVINLEASAQIEDYEEAYEEAQELVSDWLDTKLKQELACDAADMVSRVTPMQEAVGLLKYDKFDDLCDYLGEEEESTSVQKFMDHLLHKDVVGSGILDDLGLQEYQDPRQQKDPRLTMEMRHKQVKENRLRREKELARQKMEKALQKSAFLEAQCLVQEEKKRKALEAKKEEEEIQREMVKLRREILERRRTVEEAWKIEKKRQEESSQRKPEKDILESAHNPLDEVQMAKERKRKLKELLIQISKENHQCQKRYFSAWHQLILDHRIKLGKAGTLSDWKFQLKVLRAWRDYTRAQKLERETQAMENDLREENRKQQLATDYYRKQVLQHCFAAWQHWHCAEIRKRELATTKEETRRRMDELLRAASLGKLRANEPAGPRSLREEAAAAVDRSLRDGEVPVLKQPALCEKPPVEDKDRMAGPPPGRPTESTLQVPFQNTPGNTPDKTQPKTVAAEPSPQPGRSPQLGTTGQKAEPMCMGHFHHRHVFQQQLIEKQKKKLQEQQTIILQLQESQRLAEARWAAERAAAPTVVQGRMLASPREEKEPKRRSPMLLSSPAASPGSEGSRRDSGNSLSGRRRNPRQPAAPHPILKAMEERAIQRAERRWILAEKKRTQEEEKLARFKAQEEERQKREAEEKEAQLERKREEKRLKEMKEREKQKRIARNQQLEATAKEHYERVVLRKKGLEPWKRLRLQSKHNIQVATEHYSLAVQRKYLLAWFQCIQDNLAKKAARADRLYSQILLRRGIRSWQQYLADLKEEARTRYVHLLQKKMFKAWLTVAREATAESQSKCVMALQHRDRRISRTTFQTWKQAARSMQEERLKELRREQLRRKVAELLPDFQAPR
ncbi:coiled-coil domain-containing protein 191 [Echinops telfairi]|uniref:Coiled-coil domain-containing protein 191 n=1 Tax=Echinops telfairi TaxID=9371 RepID=A0ABM0IS70_ECHTE|nr:coiled-coil domain-containing protein 191 [Echinops telfairi]